MPDSCWTPADREEIERRVCAAFLRAKGSSLFRNLNLREQEIIKAAFVEAFVALCDRMSSAPRESLSGTDAILMAILEEQRAIRARLDAGIPQQQPTRGAIPGVDDRSQDIAERIADAMQGRSGMKDNLGSVKIEGGGAEDVESTVERLRKIGGGA